MKQKLAKLIRLVQITIAFSAVVGLLWGVFEVVSYLRTVPMPYVALEQRQGTSLRVLCRYSRPWF